MRIGLAGVGRIGSVHANTLRAIPEIDTLVLADAEPRRAHRLAAALHADAVSSPAELCAAGLDGLVIAASTDAHAPLIISAVDRGIPVFCEKPVAHDLAATLRVIEHVENAGVAVQIGFQRRFDSGYRTVKEAVDAGRLGWVHTLRATTADAAPPPPEYFPHSGGFFRDCSVHDFDIIRWLTGREVVEVFAVGVNRGADFIRAAGDVDTAAATLLLEDDTLATVTGARYNGAGYDARLEVLGSAASLAVGLDEQMPLRSAEPGVRWPTAAAHPDFLARFRDAYTRELADFVDIVAGRAQVSCTVHDAAAAFVIAEACELSRREARPVSVEEVDR